MVGARLTLPTKIHCALYTVTYWGEMLNDGQDHDQRRASVLPSDNSCVRTTPNWSQFASLRSVGPIIGDLDTP